MASEDTAPSRPAPWAGQAARLALAVALLAVLVWAVDRWVGWAELVRPWRALSPGAVAAALGLALVSYGARAARLHDYFRPLTDGHYAGCLRLTILHVAFLNYVPMRLGELSFPALLRRDFRMPLARAVAALLWFRMLDLHTVVALAIAVLVHRSVPLPALAALLAAWYALPWLAYRLHHPIARFARRRLPAAWHLRFDQALAGMPRDTGTLWRCVAWTVGNWAIKMAVFTWLVHSLAPTDLVPAFMGALAGELSSVIPVSGIAGAGPFEAAVVAGLMPFGVPAATALATGVNLHLFILGVALLAVPAALLIRRPHVVG